MKYETISLNCLTCRYWKYRKKDIEGIGYCSYLKISMSYDSTCSGWISR